MSTENHETNETKTSDEAIGIWQQGCEEWNKWVEKYPKANIDFSGFDFEPYRARDERHESMSEFKWPFAGFHFPQEGNVDFSYAKFGDGNVYFSEAEFGNGNVDFRDAEFGDGSVDFSEAEFGKEGHVSFCNARFGDEGHVSFNNARFGDGGSVNFSHAEFGNEGNVYFSFAEFGDGRDVDFGEANFGDGNLSFSEANFGDWNLSFSEANFGDGNVDFCHAKFGNGKVDFRHTHFGKGYTTFNDAIFGYGKVDFSHTFFASRAFFQDLQGASKIEVLSFQHATLEGGIVLSTKRQKDVENDFACVPDLRGTKYSHQITLDNIHCKPKKIYFFSKQDEDTEDAARSCCLKVIIEKICSFLEKNKDAEETARSRRLKEIIEKICSFLEQNIDAEDAARSRRLKEISEQNKDHDSALRFKALELQAARYHSNTNHVGLTLESCFRLFSNYGRSVVRPLSGLFGIWLGGGLLYSCKGGIDAPLAFSARQMFPLITSLRDRKFSYEDLGWGMDVLMFSQSILSLIFLFLLGLALRNLFRL